MIYGVFIIIFSVIQSRIDKYKHDSPESYYDGDLSRSSDAFIGTSIVVWILGATQLFGAFLMWYWSSPPIPLPPGLPPPILGSESVPPFPSLYPSPPQALKAPPPVVAPPAGAAV